MNCGQPENQGLHWEIRTETIATLLPYLLMAARVAYPSGRNSFLNKIKLARPLTERGRVGNRVAVLPNERDSAWRIKIRVGFVDDLYFRGKKKKHTQSLFLIEIAWFAQKNIYRYAPDIGYIPVNISCGICMTRGHVQQKFSRYFRNYISRIKSWPTITVRSILRYKIFMSNRFLWVIVGDYRYT